MLIPPLLPAVPDYPPPSFQEAMGASPEPSCAATQASPSSLEIPSRQSPDHQVDLSESEHSMSRGSPSETPSASESEDSLEIVGAPRPQGRARNQDSRSRGRQGIIFPSPSPTPSLGSPTYVNTNISPSSESVLSRGRTRTKLMSQLDMTEDSPEPDEEPELSLVRSTTKRFLSLSPLRTLFPPKHQVSQERAFSAHPTPGTSPYAAPPSAHFFRSTTSLASSSVLRLPFSTSTLTLTVHKPESVKSSRLFQNNEEKRRERESEEGFDDEWEMVESENSHRTEPEPRSLMAVIMPGPDTPDPVLSPEVSPTRSLSFTYGAPLTPTTLSPMVPQPNPAPPQPQPPTPSWNEPHPLSLRDKKVAEAIEPFLRRQPRKGGHHRSKTTPNPIVIPSNPPNVGPQVTTVRTRMNPARNQNNQPATNSNTDGHVHSGERHDETSERGDMTPVADESTHDFQRALQTPLPSSPLQARQSPPLMKNSPIPVSSSPSSMMITISSPTTPVPARGGVVFGDGGREGNVQPSPRSAPKAAEILDTPVQRPNDLGYICKHYTPTAKIPVPVTYKPCLQPSPSPVSLAVHSVENAMSVSSRAARRHYPGRPLPRPPQAPQPSRNVVVDSIYAGHESYTSHSSDSPNTSIPEGLLIDLDNDADANVSGSWTPPFDELYPPSAPMTPRRLSPITSSENTPDPSVRSLPHSFSSGNASSISGLSDMTDLDLLAAALTDGNGSADYEVGIASDPGSLPPNGLICTLVRHRYSLQTF